jgi:hypothetical protein
MKLPPFKKSDFVGHLVELDFRLQKRGSAFLLRPLTPAAKKWVKAHFGRDNQPEFPTIVVEPRDCEAITEGISADGLSLMSPSTISRRKARATRH